MKELDALLLRYLELHYPQADAAEKQGFEAFLAMSDPELVAYLLKGETPEDANIGQVVRRILG